MDKIFNDNFGPLERGLCEREYEYLIEGKQLPYNAIIVDRNKIGYMCGKCEGIDRHFTFAMDRRIWFQDGKSMIARIHKIGVLDETELSRVPSENFVAKIEDSTYNQLENSVTSFASKSYYSTEQNFCLKEIHDITSLKEVVFVPNEIEMLLKNGHILEVKNKVQIYKQIFDKLEEGVENNFDRLFLVKVLQTLEKSDKHYAEIKGVSSGDYKFLEELFKTKKSDIDYVAMLKKLKSLFILNNYYGFEDFAKLKFNYMLNNDKQYAVKELRRIKSELMFPGTYKSPDEISLPDRNNVFLTSKEANNILKKVSNINIINTKEDFYKVIGLFDKKLVNKVQLKNMLLEVFKRTACFSSKKLEMMRDITVSEGFIYLRHVLYSNGEYNVRMLNGKLKTLFCNYPIDIDTDIETIKEFYVTDYKNEKEKKENYFIREIISEYNKMKENKRSNLGLYNAFISHFDETFFKIKNYKIKFLFDNNELTNILNFIIKNNMTMFKEIVKKETFGYIPNKREYWSKVNFEKKLFNEIKKIAEN